MTVQKQLEKQVISIAEDIEKLADDYEQLAEYFEDVLDVEFKIGGVFSLSWG